ncbi:MAG: DUF2141 domain-containing protein [Tannerella sp.]|jgi:uncharacterized protein (DUF2141 family)|nr:DUF2141 domain-containing protein [Tannerella sp.]
MKTLKILGMAIVLCMLTGAICKAQTADVTVMVDGIKEAKGKLMIAAGDKSNPQEMKYDMVEVKSTDPVVCVLKDVPVGTCNLYVYQDLNDNYRLDMDDQNLPVEPCYTKEKMKVKEGENKIELKLLNVREMMGKK